MRKRFWRHGPDDFRPYPPESAVPPRFGQAPKVIKPFTPYQSVVDCDENGVGDWIMTRDAHRESLRRNNCIEMGKDFPDPHLKRLKRISLARQMRWPSVWAICSPSPTKNPVEHLHRP